MKKIKKIKPVNAKCDWCKEVKRLTKYDGMHHHGLMLCDNCYQTASDEE